MQVETVEQFLARGGKITRCPSPGEAMGRRAGVVCRKVNGGAMIAVGEQHFYARGCTAAYGTRIEFDPIMAPGKSGIPRQFAANWEISEVKIDI